MSKAAASEVDKATQDFLGDVARLMEEKGISQAELARRLEVSPAYISKILNGRVNLTVATLQKVAKALEAPMSLRLGVSGVDVQPSTETANQDTPESTTDGEAEASELARQDLEATAKKLMDQLDPEAVSRIMTMYENGARRGPGRPMGSGLIQDDDLLERMADQLVAKKAGSERQAARIIAADDPGFSEKATARRLRRKFAADREKLLAAARERRRRQREPQERARRRARPDRSIARPDRPVTRPAVGADYASSTPMVEMEGTTALLADLQEQFQIDRLMVKQLRSPYMLEAIAQLGNMREDLSLASLATDSVAEVTQIDDAVMNVTKESATLASIPRCDDAVVDVTKVSATLASIPRTDYPMTNAASAIGSSRAITENLAATDLSDRVPTTKTLGYNRAASADITGQREISRQLDPWGEINRRMRRLTKPWSE